eukprot:873633-Rhodomonas_salina.2
MSQIDFLLIRAFADGLVNAYTTFKFLKYKKYDVEKYTKWYHKDTEAGDTEEVAAEKCTTSTPLNVSMSDLEAQK